MYLAIANQDALDRTAAFILPLCWSDSVVVKRLLPNLSSVCSYKNTSAP